MSLFKKKIPEKDELYLRDIVQKYCEDDDVKKYVTSTGAYLHNELDEIHIWIQSSKIKISNHKFVYEKNIRLQTSDKLIKKVTETINDIVKKIGNEVFKNEIDLLRHIFTK